MTKQKIIKIVGVVLVIVIVVLLIWFVFLYPKKVFSDNEKEFNEAGLRYFEINKSFLPKEEGRVISVTLDTLIKQDYLNSLYVPYSNELCDLKESTVKAVNNGDEYKYYTYLKCGNYESNVDHEGPVITLKGDTEVTVSRGEEYKDPGVSSVVDNVDGEMDVSSVRIKGEVDTSTVGIYEITYTASDSLNNSSEVVRKVKVEERLSSIVNESTEKGYYVGNIENNYIMFNNMLFRIVKVNDDNSVTIVSNDSLANVDYTNDGRFAGSTLDEWLNNYFYNLLEPRYQKLIKSSNWCDDIITSENYSSITECNRESAKRKIGILSVQDYNKSYDGKGSYLDKDNLTWYANFDNDNKPWALTTVAIYPNGFSTSDANNLLNVVPALTLKANTTVLDGDGSLNNPYTLLNDSKGRRGSVLNDREIGEYVNYSGYLFRISDTLDDGTTEVIMTSVLKSDDQEIVIGYENSQKSKIYNPNQEGNIGYQIKNNMTSYISTGLFTNKKIKVPIYKNKITYKGDKEEKEYNLLISIPSTFDIFSAKGALSTDRGYWLIDSSREENIKTLIRSLGTITYSGAPDSITSGVKVKAYFNKNVFITDGSGTSNDPYEIDD